VSRVLIVGAGVVGLCTALYCRRRGHDVVVVDRDGPEHLSCSFGNAGMLTPSHFVPLAAPGAVRSALRWMWNPNAPLFVRPRASLDFARWLLAFRRSATAAHVERAAPLLRDLNLASRACYEALDGELGGDFGLSMRGMLMICRTAHGMEEESRAAAMAERLQLPTRVLSVRAAREMEPLLRADIAGAVHYPMDAHLAPDRFVRRLRGRLAADGVRFVWNRQVSAWRLRSGPTQSVAAAVMSRSGANVDANGGANGGANRTARNDANADAAGDELVADEFVICGGSWSPALARAVGVDIPLEAGAGYSFTLERPQAQPSYPSILVERRVAVTPMGDRLRVGGTMELSGLDPTIRLGRARAILESLAAYYEPAACTQFDAVTPWKGFRPCSPDGLPYVGRMPGTSNLTIATGHAMMGLSLAPITGKLVAELLSGEPSSFPMQQLAVDRFVPHRAAPSRVQHA
jgi:D-amino-acid dehydrogenase